MQIIIYLQDPKLTLHPSIPLLSIVLCPTEEMGDVRSPRVPLKKENVLQWRTCQLLGEHSQSPTNHQVTAPGQDPNPTRTLVFLKSLHQTFQTNH